MPLKLMYITNDPRVAVIAEEAGVDWIFIDLEINGKEKRQGHLDTVISYHKPDDIKAVKQVLNSAELLVRINPVYKKTEKEIETAICNGADIIMLPYYTTFEEVKYFLDKVNGRVKTCLLCENRQAVEIMDDVLALKGIDYIHIGLNDLHLSYGMKFMFQPLANGMVDALVNKINKTDIVYGFGGIARLGEGLVSSEKVIGEHYRLGSQMAILSRSFCNLNQITEKDILREIFTDGVAEIRKLESQMKSRDADWFYKNRLEVVSNVKAVVEIGLQFP